MFRFVTGFALCATVVAAQQPDERDESWIHAPEHVADAIKHRRLGRHHRAALLTERGTEGTGAAKVLHDIGRAQSALASVLQGHPELLRKEDDLLHKASEMALEAGEAQASAMNLKSEMKSKVKITSALKEMPKDKAVGTVNAKVDKAPLVGVQKTEASLIGEGFGILHEAKEIKGAVVDAIGESDPRTASKVEHLMDELQKDQSGIMRGEEQFANGLGNILHEAPMVPSHKKHAALAQHKTRVSTVAEMVTLATEERKLSHDEIQTLSSVEQVKAEVAQALKSNPSDADHVAGLLDTVEKVQRNIVHIDEAAAASDQKLVSHTAHSHHKKTALAEATQRNTKVVSESSEMGSLASSEAKLSHDDALTLSSVELIKGAAANALESSPSAAEQVASLMGTLEKDQRHIVNIDQTAMTHDKQLAAEERHHKPALAQQRSKVVSSEDAVMMSKLLLRERQLQTAVSKREGLAKQSTRILAETDRAQAAIEEQLGGTDTGAQVAEILQKAEAAERSVAKGAKQQVALAKNEVQAAKKFADSMAQHESSHDSHVDVEVVGKLAHNEHALRDLEVARQSLAEKSEILLAQAQAAENLAAGGGEAARAKKNTMSIARFEQELRAVH